MDVHNVFRGWYFVLQNVFALFDLFGMVDTISITSSAFCEVFNCSRPPSLPSTASSDSIEVQLMLVLNLNRNPLMMLHRELHIQYS